MSKHKRIQRRRMTARWGALLLALGAAPAFAQDSPEVPDIVIEAPEVDVGKVETDDIQLGNVVLTASKSRTTIQEAPAIVTVITADEIKANGLRTLTEVLNRIPGWMDHGGEHHQFEWPATRGTIQAALPLHDGVSAFDFFANAASWYRVNPMELMKRVEVITGPGGVLWGSNSYLGIVNMITKDVEDIRGVEARVGYGDGPGDAKDFKAYAMAGQKFLKGKLKVVLHTSYERFGGLQATMPAHIFSTPLPQPNSRFLYGPMRDTNYPMSYLVQGNAKVSYGPLSLYLHVPFGERYFGMGFPGNLPQDDPPGGPAIDDGMGGVKCDTSGGAVDPDAECYDPNSRGRHNRLDWYDRYAALEYRGGFNQNKVQLNAKAFVYQLVKHFNQLHVLPGSALLRGGLSFDAQPKPIRYGVTADVNIAVTKKINVIAGSEFNYERMPAANAKFWGPDNLAQLPLPCPLEDDPNMAGQTRIVGTGLPGPQGCPVTFVFGADRVVLAGFLNGQVHVTNALTLDGGGRIQVAPGGDTLPNSSVGDDIHRRGYDAQILGSGAAVYKFLNNYHLKLNYAQGFRSPVFNNTEANGEAVEIGGSPKLKIERSQSGQIEVNARVLKNVRTVRELSLRADYSLTRLTNFIQVANGATYSNLPPRDIHGVEFLGKLALQGGHSMEMGYSYLRTVMEDKGFFRGTPEHWFTMSGVFDTGKYVDINTGLRVMGAFEDPNRLVDLSTYNPVTKSAIVAQPSDVVVDRIPSQAQLQFGIRLKNLGVKGLEIKADTYNTFNNQGYQGDYFYDHTPRLEILPNPTARFRFFAYAEYKY